MANIIQGIKGVGSITNAGDLGYNLPNWQVFNGNYCTIANYVPLEINLPRTYLVLAKNNSAVSSIYLSTRNHTSIDREERVEVSNEYFYTLFVDTTAMKICTRSNTKCVLQKVHCFASTYNGNGAIGINNYSNGKSGDVIIRNDAITSIINTNVAYIGAYIPSVYPIHNLRGSIAILTIVNRILTPAEIIKFNTDPFGFNNSLTPAECHLRVDFNRVSGQVPLDTSSFARTISVTGNSVFAQFP